MAKDARNRATVTTHPSGNSAIENKTNKVARCPHCRKPMPPGAVHWHSPKKPRNQNLSKAQFAWYPDMDTAGNRNPSGHGMLISTKKTGVGTHAEGYDVIHNSIRLSDAQDKYGNLGGVVEKSHTIPVTVPAKKKGRKK